MDSVQQFALVIGGGGLALLVSVIASNAKALSRISYWKRVVIMFGVIAFPFAAIYAQTAERVSVTDAWLMLNDAHAYNTSRALILTWFALVVGYGALLYSVIALLSLDTSERAHVDAGEA